MTNNVKKITEGAVLCALIGVFLIINRMLGEFSDIILLWVVPIPVIIYSIRYGIKNCFVFAFSVIFLTVILAGPQTIFYVLASLTVGMVYGWGLRNGKGAGWLIATTIIGSFVITFVTTFLLAGFFGIDLALELKLVEEAFMETYKAQGGDISALSSDIVRISYYSLLFVSSVIEGFLVHMLTALVLVRLKISVPPTKLNSVVKSPTWLGYIAIAVILGSRVAPFFTLNTQILEILVYMNIAACGVAAWYGYLTIFVMSRMFKMRSILIMFVAITFLFFNIAILILVAIGLLDMTVDLKGKIMRRVQNETYKS